MTDRSNGFVDFFQEKVQDLSDLANTRLDSKCETSRNVKQSLPHKQQDFLVQRVFLEVLKVIAGGKKC